MSEVVNLQRRKFDKEHAALKKQCLGLHMPETVDFYWEVRLADTMWDNYFDWKLRILFDSLKGQIEARGIPETTS